MGGCLCKSKKKRRGRLSGNRNTLSTNVVQNTLGELIETEKSYGRDIKYLSSTYLEALRLETLFFDQTDLIAYNSVTLDLIQVQTKFQEQLVKATGNLEQAAGIELSEIICNVSDIFIDSEKNFDVYSKYILCMSRVQKLISKSQGIDKIVSFLETKFEAIQKLAGKVKDDAEGMQKGKIMTMESLVMKPFQRIMLYPLILERIEKHCDNGTADKEQVQMAIQVVKRVAASMNDTLKQDEQSSEGFKQILKEYGILEYDKKE